MTYHILDTVARAGVWRAMHAVGPPIAAVIAIVCFGVLLWRAR